MRRGEMLIPSAIAAALGLIASVVASLIADPEIVGAAILVVGPLLLLSVAIVWGMEAVGATSLEKRVGFAAPLALAVGVVAYAIWGDARAMMDRGVSDGAGDFAQFFMNIYVVGLVVASLFLAALAPRGRAPAHTSLATSQGPTQAPQPAESKAATFLRIGLSIIVGLVAAAVGSWAWAIAVSIVGQLVWGWAVDVNPDFIRWVLTGLSILTAAGMPVAALLCGWLAFELCRPAGRPANSPAGEGSSPSGSA